MPVEAEVFDVALPRAGSAANPLNLVSDSFRPSPGLRQVLAQQR
jgi:hypothetical protein